MIMMDSPQPELRLSLRVVVPVVLGFTGIAMFLVRLGLAAQRARPVTGDVGMIGEVGRVVAPIEPGKPGRIVTHGEIWHANADHSIEEGAQVRVIGVEGLTLAVRRETSANDTRALGGSVLKN
jgi:membrane-bound serine protease (ClpP class)